MSDISFDATVHQERRSATISMIPEGYLLQTDPGSFRFRGFGRAVEEARDYLGPFLAPADRKIGPPWGLRVCVSTGCAFYGPNPPRSAGGGGIPVAPDERLAKIRGEYKEGDGSLAALKNATKIARAYPPKQEARAA
ncbi:MAG TPA: hypothetical protein VM184_10780 [Gaiellaceae bacterium]|nr:hypothetical protein [Gaiellaceae bacterium]